MTLLFRSFLFFLWTAGVHCLPYMLLTKTRSKCVSIIAPQGQVVTIEYHVPDMQVAGDGDEDEGKEDYEASQLADAAKEAKGGADGLDKEWNKRVTEKLERMKSRMMRDMSITVSQKSGLTGALASRQRRTNRGEKVTGQGRIREELSQRQGSIEFMTGDSDGTVDICIQSIIASATSPSRFSLNVTIAPQEEEKKEEKDSKDEVMDRNLVKTQMSRLERDLQTLNNRVKAILSNADFNKDQEVAFHEQSEAMNRAATYWPIIQLIVLLITGFTQANHIVRFMKSRHIG